MPTIHEIPFENILDILKETGEPLHPGYLYRFSDLEAKEIAMLGEIWGTLPLQNRQALMGNLEQIGSEDMLLSFEAVGRFTLRDDDPKVRKSAVRILHEYELPDLITIFLQMLETDNNEEVRAEAARGLGQYVYLGEIEELPEDMQRKVEVSLLQALKSHQAPIVQQRALESLSFSSRDEVPPLIERAFSSEDKEWIATALVAMGRSADKRWETEVMAMLTNKYPTLRTEAARAAGELELTEAIPYLLDMLDDDSKDVRMASIWALSQIGGEGIRERLENLLASAREEDEVNLMENALDNLSFTEDFQLFSLFDFSERDIEEEILDVLGEEDFHQDEDNEDLLD